MKNLELAMFDGAAARKTGRIDEVGGRRVWCCPK